MKDYVLGLLGDYTKDTAAAAAAAASLPAMASRAGLLTSLDDTYTPDSTTICLR